MGHSARILADSLSPDGVRLTTFEVTFPRIILAEVNTHRMLSRNSASSRAIPVKKMIQRVEEDPYIPTSWGKNQKGMQAGEEVDEVTARYARVNWLAARDEAVDRAGVLLTAGIHKQLTNRLLEPFMWHTAILSATEWSNFLHLRNHPDAHPDFQVLASQIQECLEECEPQKLDYGQWHLPLVDWAHDDDSVEPGIDADWRKVSVGRCARVSYLTHDGKRDPEADIALHDKLLAAGHLSPAEHVARPATKEDTERVMALIDDVSPDGYADPDQMWFGNFRGWVQYRKTIPHEHDILGGSGA